VQRRLKCSSRRGVVSKVKRVKPRRRWLQEGVLTNKSALHLRQDAQAKARHLKNCRGGFSARTGVASKAWHHSSRG
jgi:hypothetical protein